MSLCPINRNDPVRVYFGQDSDYKGSRIVLFEWDGHIWWWIQELGKEPEKRFAYSPIELYLNSWQFVEWYDGTTEGMV